MESYIFHGLDGRGRSEKPRRSGYTTVVDWGMGPHAQLDFLITGAAYVDFAKVAVGVSRLLPTEVLIDKIRTYQKYGVEPFPGGQYLEYAETQRHTDRYFFAVLEAGYGWVEVSDNLASVSLDWKTRMIREATLQHGLQVLGEVGKKEGLGKTVSMAEDAAACLEAGAQIILLEAAELINTDPETTAEVEAVVSRIGVERVIFELPGPWIDGVAEFLIHRMRRELVDRYGPDVNVGNMAPDDLIAFEAYRRGLGVNAGK